jgi:hypothetical protein
MLSNFSFEQRKNTITMKKQISLLLIVAGIVTVSSAAFGFDEKQPLGKDHANTIIIQWNALAQEIMQNPGYNPMDAARILAMIHLAMHDALNCITPVYETYAWHQEDRKADPIVAVSASAHTVLLALFPSKREQLDSALSEAIVGIMSHEGKQHGLALGRAAGNAIVNQRKGDNVHLDPITEITNPKEPGLYQAVPPMTFLYAPYWKDLQPFGLERPDQFRIDVMPLLTSEAYTMDFNEVKAKGALQNSTRTDEETTIAKFWYEFSEIGWNRIAVTVARQKNLNLVSTARLFALVNMALADAYIAGWDSKIHYNFWRPYTAIRVAETDGNTNTEGDAEWEPLMVTPPVQDYPSTHSALGNAAAAILSNEFGDHTSFTFSSTSAVPANSTRSFQSFSQAAKENADSRVLAGLHFRFSCEKGLDLGNQVGLWIIQNHLRAREHKGL